MNVARTTIRGITALAYSKVALTLVSLATTTAMARFLGPQDFGLIGMTSLVMGLFAALNSLGIDSTIVGNKDLTQAELSTLYWVKMLVAIGSFLLMAATALPIARFYKEPRLTWVIVALGTFFISSALYQMHRSLLKKQARFAEIARFNVVSTIWGGIAAVVAAGLGAGVWCLLIQTLAQDIVSFWQFRGAEKWRPSWIFDWRGSRRVLKYGANMFGTSISLYLQRNIDYLIISKMLGKEPLGFYTMAYRIMYQPVRQISYLFTDVLFPVLASIRDDLPKVRETFANSLKFTAMITFPTMTWIGFVATDFVLTFFGSKWLPTAELLRIMALAGAVQSVAQIGYLLYPAMGRADLSFRLGVANCLIIATGVAIGAWKGGVTGVAIGITLGTVASWIFSQTLAHRICQWNWLAALKGWTGSTTGCAAIGCVWFGLQLLRVGDDWLPVARLAIYSVLMCSAYLVVLWLLDRVDIVTGLKLFKDRKSPPNPATV